MNTRAIITAITAAAAVTISGCGDDSTDAANADPVAGSFVAETSDPDTFVALVAAEPDGATDTRELRVYVCDGEEVGEWFKGPIDGNAFELASNAGAEVAGRLESGTATGTITLPDGTALAFDAVPADGIAGLYDVAPSPDGVYRGSSYDGDQLEAVIGELDATGFRPLDVTFTPTQGDRETLHDQTPAHPERPRWIVLDDGRMKGIEVHPIPTERSKRP